MDFSKDFDRMGWHQIGSFIGLGNPISAGTIVSIFRLPYAAVVFVSQMLVLVDFT